MSAFEHGENDKFLKEYIVNRVISDGKGYKNLSNRLHRILEALVDHENCSREQYRELLEKLVTAMLHNFTRSLEVLLRLDYTTAPSRICEDAFKIDCLLAAALLGVSHRFNTVEADVLCGRLRETSGNFNNGVLYDSSLALAALGGQCELVTRILETRPKSSGLSAANNFENNIAVKCAILGGHDDIVRLLLTFSHDYERCSLLAHARSALHFSRPYIFRLICNLCDISPSEPRL